MPFMANAAVVNVVDNGTAFVNWHLSGYQAVESVPGITLQKTATPFADLDNTAMIVANAARRFDVDYGQLYDYISGGGRFVLYSDYSNTSTYPDQHPFTNEILTNLSVPWSISGISGGNSVNMNTDNPFAEGVSGLNYAAAGNVSGVAGDDVVAWGEQGQVMFASYAIGDGYLFLSADVGVYSDELALNLLTVNSALPIPGAVWLFGSALAGLGWMRRRRTA